MLYFETPDAFVLWTGQPVKGVRHPLNIEDVWTDDAEFAKAGLFKPAEADPVPEGKIISETKVVRVGGVVKYVHTLADAPVPTPADFPLTDRQLRIGLIMAGIPLSTITDAIDGIADPAQRAIAEVWWDRSIQIEWAHPMTQQLIALAGLTQAQAKAMWLSAKGLES